MAKDTSHSKKSLILLLLNFGMLLQILRTGVSPVWGESLAILAVGGLVLESRSIQPKGFGPLSCSLAAALAMLALPDLAGLSTVLLLALVMVVRWLRQQGSPQQTFRACVADLTPVFSAAFALSWISVGDLTKRVAIVSLVFFFISELVLGFLYARQLEEKALRRRYGLATLLSAVPLSFLSTSNPLAALFFFPLMLVVQQGGYGLTLRDRRENLVVASEKLREARTEVKKVSRAERLKTKEVRQKETDRKLVVDFARFFARNPSVDEILQNMLGALERLLRPRPIVLFTKADDNFAATSWTELAQRLGKRLKEPLNDTLLLESWSTGRVLNAREWEAARLSPLVREAGPGLALPLGRYGAAYVVIEVELSERHGELLQTIATQVGLGLEAAIYREKLSVALGDRTRALEQLKESQAQLVQSGKMAAVGQLAAGVAHELNSPLAATLLQLQAAQMRLDSGKTDKVSRSLEVAERTTTKAQQIINKLLCFSHPAQEQRVQVSVPSLLDDTLEMVGVQLEKSGVELVYEPQPCSVKGDPLELQQVVTNLLLNARDAALSNKESRKPSARLSVQVVENQVKLIVADSGAGIDPDIIDRIFEPFFTTKQIGEGTGLGLSISYQLAQAHGGSLEACNLADGGAEFRLRLPAWDPDY
jgi:C4-dicarboxylate-specific signal transduction histidine kinase